MSKMSAEQTEEMVTISKSEYDSLWEDRKWLNSLQAAGVDNWIGYADAQEIHAENYPEEDE